MDLNVPTIAQRKAARRNQVPTSETNQTPTPATPQTDQPIEVAHQLATLTETSVQSATTATPLTPKPVSSQPQSNTPDPQIDKATLIAIARSMGLELTPPKKLWIKHSYSVTPESKQKFTSYCDVLGIKMQDGLEEAFQDWFKKKELEFKAVSDAKNT